MENKLSIEQLKSCGFVEAKYFDDNIKPSAYYVNMDGKVYSTISDSFLVIKPDDEGYIRLTLRDKNDKPKHYPLHRLVAYTFLGNPSDITDPEVDHIDRNRANNNVLNLRWVSRIDNLSNRLITKGKGLTYSDVHDICQRIASHDFDTLADLAKEYGVSRETISDIYRGKSWKLVSKHYNLQNYKASPTLSDSIVHSICRDIVQSRELINGENRPITLKMIADKYNVGESVIKSIAQYKSYLPITSQYNFGPTMKEERIKRREPIYTAYRFGIPAKELRDKLGVPSAYDIYADFIRSNREIDFTQDKEEFTINDIRTEENKPFTYFHDNEISILDIIVPKHTRFTDSKNEIKPISDDTVHEICRELELNNCSNLAELARRFKTSPNVVYDIKMGRNYKYISTMYNISTERNISSVTSKKGILKIAKEVQESRKGCIYTEPTATLGDIAKNNGVTEAFVKNIVNRTEHKELTKDFDFGVSQKQRRQNRKNLVFTLLDFGLSLAEVRSETSFCVSKDMCDSYKREYERSGNTPKFTLSKIAHTIFDVNEDNPELPGFSNFL